MEGDGGEEDRLRHNGLATRNIVTSHVIVTRRVSGYFLIFPRRVSDHYRPSSHRHRRRVAFLFTLPFFTEFPRPILHLQRNSESIEPTCSSISVYACAQAGIAPVVGVLLDF